MSWTLGLAGVLLISGPALAACAPPGRQAVADTIIAMYAAAENNDTAKLNTILAPGFYAFDAGKRFDRSALEATIGQYRAQGKIMHWQVTVPDIHVGCETAWIAYVNQGSMTAGGKVTPITWLESADLRFVDGAWRVDFLQSARQAKP